MEASGYFVRSRGKVVGPVALAALKQMARRGQVSRATEVSTDRATWTAAGEVEGLFEVPAPVAAVAVRGGEAEEEDRTYAVGGESPATVAGVPEGGRYYFAQRGQSVGPMPLEALKAMCLNGTLGAQDPVWREGDAQALPAERVAALAALFTGGAGVGGGRFDPRRGGAAAPAMDTSEVGGRAESEAVVVSLVAGAVAVLLTFVPSFVVNREGRFWWQMIGEPGTGMLTTGMVATLLVGVTLAVGAPLLRGRALSTFLLSVGGVATAAILMHMVADRGVLGLVVCGYLLTGLGAACGSALATARACRPGAGGVRAGLWAVAICTTLLAVPGTVLAVAAMTGYSEVTAVVGSGTEAAVVKLMLLGWLVACMAGLVAGVLAMIAASIVPGRGLVGALRGVGDGCVGVFLAVGTVLAVLPREVSVAGLALVPLVSYVLVLALVHGLRTGLLAGGGR